MALYTEPAAVNYPPAPWRMRGGAWVSLFAADRAVGLPHGLTHVLPPRLIVVALVCYREGTLQYDELIIGALARRGVHLGLHVQHIWVNDVQSLWGGRNIWGLPKMMADFAWNGNTVRVTDAAGLILTASVDARIAWLPRIPLLAPVWGWRDSRWLYAIATGNARPGRANVQITDWSDRFPYRIPTTPLVSVGLKPFRMTIPAPSA